MLDFCNRMEYCEWTETLLEHCQDHESAKDSGHLHCVGDSAVR